MRRLKKTFGGERGEVMIESLLVYLVTVLLLFLILALTCVWYQRLTVNIVANDTAEKIASSFRMGSSALEDGRYTEDDLKQMKQYRYMLFNYAELREKAENATTAYAMNRLTRSSFFGTVSEDETDITFSIESDGIGRRHVVVSITGTYNLPFKEVFEYFGMSDYAGYTVNGYAECMDILAYYSDVAFASNIASTIVGDLGSSGKAADAVVSMVNRVVNLIKEFMNS